MRISTLDSVFNSAFDKSGESSQRGSILTEIILTVTLMAFLLSSYGTLRSHSLKFLDSSLMKTHVRMTARSAARLSALNDKISDYEIMKFLNLSDRKCLTVSVEKRDGIRFSRTTYAAGNLIEGGVCNEPCK
ncbi:MAG: hypothetical protein CVV64_10840 [Candidatus Wallbacteria bacterium HGW-Wallbacteria-1]|jgi:hypothetical protein|uniref:Uncharacterized protein n=1 Tax=Candidatus Wallbacteria bacterium HGW-Wallbacteria-1 TaxID=2013854 RepID=A0A2N1PPE8_9BACT|nr:MAG: hypothetical protein CVV64_10840 [Candidatus Wallbacteria bacterium HGW-Wallbacteria-1]